ncbi:PAS domain S-box protein [Myxococcus sp. AS-1-15]|uniref:sensor histidine kinase n=1 Tax=Myxococcus TaxID=32 RepID=UPI001CBCD48D|nr:PAS domain S-box protein [Myxococcus sp. AS-1-15]MBZ4400687.1 PAS domain S-box protein [Myxococcus sp. AS-1-15]BDT33000.1 PAS domain S-box protein [Myxococcus sp. MH1]
MALEEDVSLSWGGLLARWGPVLRTRHGLRRERAGLVQSGLEEVLPVLLAALARALQDDALPPSAEVLRYLRAGQAERWHACHGLEACGVVQEYGLLHDCLLELMEEAGVTATPRQQRMLAAVFHAASTDAVGRLASSTVASRSEGWLQAIIDHAPPVIFAKDAQGRFVLVNRSFEEALGRSRSSVLGKTDFDLFPAAVARRNREHDERVRQSLRPVTEDEHIPGVQGVRTWFAMKFPLPTVGAEGPIICGISTDITDARRTHEALRESEERFRLLMDAVEDYAILLLDPEGRVVSWNAGAERLTGWQEQEVLGRHYALFAPEEQVTRGEPQRLLREVADGGHFRGELRRKRRDGSCFWADLDIAAVRDEAGRLRGFANVARDITAKKQSETARDFLLEAGRVLAGSLDLETTLGAFAGLVVEHVSDYCVVDLLEASGRLVRQEAAAREPERQDLIRKLLAFAPRTEEDGPLARALALAQPIVVPEVTSRFLDSVSSDAAHRALLEALGARSAALVPVVSRGRALGLIHLVWTRPHDSLEMEALVELARGVADRAAVAIENARLYREARDAVRVREDVVAIVSHDLRNPLHAIQLTATSLLRKGTLPEGGVKGLERIMEATQRASRLIRDLLDFTQARAGERIPIRPCAMDLHVLARKVVDEVLLAHPRRDIQVELRGDGRLEADADRLAQVVSNLVGNALQHSAPDSCVRVHLREAGDGVLLEVHNVGRPIAAGLLPTLFEPYRRGPEARAGQGSIGLGLYISRQIVLGHGGSIEVFSNERGTCFKVWLPRRRGP